MKYETPTVERLMQFQSNLRRRMVVPELGECWEWAGGRTGGPMYYGKFRERPDSKPRPAHSMALEWLGGEEISPDKPLACHKCDNTLCCNPSHIFAGTGADNQRDKAQKKRGRSARGAQHPIAKMTDDYVAFCRLAVRARLLRPRQIADYVQTNINTVYKMLNGKQWKHIATPPVTASEARPRRHLSNH